MKRISKIILFCIIFSLLTFPLSASALDTARQDWCFKSNGNDKPDLLFGSDLVNRYPMIALGSGTEKVIYLTFDAGYENGNVAKILDTLDKHHAKGAFFILPGLVKYAPDLVKRMANSGQTVCNHSTTHKDLSATTKENFLTEMHTLEEKYKALTGKEMTRFFRPPEGAFSENLLAICEETGYMPVFWSYAYADWDNDKQPNPETAKQKILANLHPGEVLLLHPTSATNAAILDDLMTEMEKRGYRFGTLDEFKTQPTAANDYSKIDDYKEKGLVFAENRGAGKTLALTFDDGPHPTQTDEILKVLAKYGVQATFFPIGENVCRYPEVTKRVFAAGHELGNHTYRHRNVTTLSEKELQEELQSTEKVLQEQCGVTPTVFRPPGGAFSETAIQTVRNMGYRYVLWAWRTDPKDWASAPTDRIVKTVLDNVRDGDVLLFHDSISGVSHTAEALDKLIPALLSEGYSFTTVSALAAM